jgi:hypothetical protein
VIRCTHTGAAAQVRHLLSMLVDPGSILRLEEKFIPEADLGGTTGSGIWKWGKRQVR